MTTSTISVPARSERQRIVALDVLRGFALCGIILVNIGPLTHFEDAAHLDPVSLSNPGGWLQLLVQQRFFPIFSLLFGIGFSLFFESAKRKARGARLPLARRLLLLLALGIVFNFIQPGEALLPYAIAGLVVLLPSTWLPRWAVPIAATIFIGGSLVLFDGGLTLIPGLFLLGSTLTRYGVVWRIGSSRRGALVALGICTLLAIPLVRWQISTIINSDFSFESAAAGLAIAGVYASLLMFLMTTRVAKVIEKAFAPLGKMALTNYVAAAPLMLCSSLIFDFSHSSSWGTLLGSAVFILVLQWMASTLWLRRFAQGPLEWLWRWGTWGHRAPFRRMRKPDRIETAV